MHNCTAPRVICACKSGVSVLLESLCNDYMEALCATFRAARLHTTVEKGFYTGRIEAVDLERHRYWVTFDRPGLGKHAILDTEIRVSTKKPIHVHMYTVHVHVCSDCHVFPYSSAPIGFTGVNTHISIPVLAYGQTIHVFCHVLSDWVAKC